MIPERTFRQGRLVSLGFYGLAIAVVLVGEASRDETLSLGRIALLLVASLGLVFTAISSIRASRYPPPLTIRRYFGALQFLGTNLTLGVFCIFCGLLFAPTPLRPGDSQLSIPVWYPFVVVALSVHQYVRGARRVAAKWRSADDVLRSIQEGTVKTQGFVAKYDFGFFVGMSFVVSIASRYFGSGQVLLLSGLIGALCFPYLLGVLAAQRAVLARLLPHDIPFPRA